MSEIEIGLYVVVVFAFIVCFLLTWTIGANDVANTFGTSVGAKVLTVNQACVIAAIFEFAGAFLMGSHVADTFRDKLLFTNYWENEPWELAVGMTASMIGAFVLILLATFFSLPVSGTHAILGAVLGFAVLSRGIESVQWNETFFIIAGWILSPLLAGSTAFAMFWMLRRFILRSPVSFEKGIKFIPFCYGATVSLVALFILYKGSAGVDLSTIPSWAIIVAVIVLGMVTGIIVWLLTPYIEHAAFIKAGLEHELDHRYSCSCTGLPAPSTKVNMEELEDNTEPSSAQKVTEIEKSSEVEIELDKIPNQENASKATEDNEKEAEIVVSLNEDKENTEQSQNENTNTKEGKNQSEKIPVESIEEELPGSEEFDPCTEQLFSMGQVLMAIVGSFAHGANDIANAIGPFAVVIGVYNTGTVYATGAIPWWILVLGGIGIVSGLAMWGYRVIQTIGERLTKVTPSRGFNIELGSAITVMSASRIGIPLSTTHCKVGAVIGVGLGDGGAAVQWKMVGNVAVGWFVTLPIAGAVSAVVFLFMIGLGDYS